MDGESEAGSLENGSNMEDEQNSQTAVTDEFFAELISKANAAIKSLQADQQIIAAEEFQMVFNVCQNLRKNLHDEQDRMAQLKKEIDILSERAIDATKYIERNDEIIKKQRCEIEEAWSERDAAQQREKTTKTQMYTMREKLDKLEADVKKSQTMGDDEPGMSLAKYKEAMKREQDRLNNEIDDLNRKLNIQRQNFEEVEKKKTELDTKNKELYKILDETSSDAFKEKRILDQLKIALAEVTSERNTFSDQIKNYKLQYEAYKTKNIHLNLKIGAAKANLERQVTQNNVTNGKLTKAQADIDALTVQNDKLQIELNQESTLLKLKEVDYNRIAKENSQLLKSRETLQKKLVTTETEKTNLVKEVAKLRNTTLTLEKAQETNRKSFYKINKTNAEIMREREIMRKDLKKAEDVLDDQRDVIKLQEQHLLSLDSEIKGHSLTIRQQTILLSNAERERDRNATTSHTQTGKADTVQLEFELKTKQYADLKESFEMLQVKFSHLQQQYDFLMSERNVLQRDLDATLADREIVREKLRMSVSKREKLNEQLIAKGTEIYRIGKQIDRLEKDKSVLRNDIKNITLDVQHIKTELAEKCVENTGLYKTLADNEKKFVRLNKQLEATQQRKDLIETQLFKRNDKMDVLNEKQQIVQMALDRGNSHYRNRLDDIALLKIEIGNLRSQKNLLSRGLANTVDMRQEVLQLNRDLTQERVKAKALEQEMMTPMNIHRWRKLTGKDPNQMDLIVKIQTLQKRILVQTSTASRKETQMHQISFLYEAVKDAMVKMPGPAVLVKLTKTQRVLTANTRKLKTMSAEANAKDLDNKVKEFTLQVMKRDLFDSKQKLLKEKREKHKFKSELEIIRQQLTRESHSNIDSPLPNMGYKTAGAGFRIPTVFAYD